MSNSIPEVNFLDLNTPYKLAYWLKNLPKDHPSHLQHCYTNQSILTNQKPNKTPSSNHSSKSDLLSNDYLKKYTEEKKDIEIPASKIPITRGGLDAQQSFSSWPSIQKSLPSLPYNESEISFSSRKVSEWKREAKKIAHAMFSGKWTGIMLYNTESFDKKTFESILECNGIDTKCFISQYIWYIIWNSQTKLNEETSYENISHVKWFWYDHNNFIWRKFQVPLCLWFTHVFKMYIKNPKKNVYDFKEYEKYAEEKETGKKVTIFRSDNIEHKLVIMRIKNKIYFEHQIKIGDKKFCREIRNENGVINVFSNMIDTKYLSNHDPFLAPSELH